MKTRIFILILFMNHFYHPAGCNTGRNLHKEVVTNILHCESVRVYRLTRRIGFVIKNGLFFGRNGNAENADFFLLKPLDFFLVEIFP